MPPRPTGSAWKPMASGRVCPAAAIPMTTPLRRTSSAASSVSWSTSSTTPQGLQHRTMCLLISKPSTTPSAPILPLAGVRLHALRLNLPLPPPDCSTFYLCVFIRLFPLVLCPFLGEGLRQHHGEQPFGFQGQLHVAQVVVGHHCVIAGFLNAKYRHGITSLRRFEKVFVFGEKTPSMPPKYPGGEKLWAADV